MPEDKLLFLRLELRTAGLGVRTILLKNFLEVHKNALYQLS